MNRTHRLTKNKIQKAGRNNHGRITVFHRGGGNKKLYRVIDYKRALSDTPAIVKRLEYDPNRTSKTASVRYKNGMLSYLLAPKNSSPGDKVVASKENVEIAIGNASPVGQLPTGTVIHNIELKPGGGGKPTRAAGSNAKIISPACGDTNMSLPTSADEVRKGSAAVGQGAVIIRLSGRSGRLYSIGTQAMATIGIVPNDSHKNEKTKKAGEAR
jgi:large subunit ribosomal protein L2